MAERGAVTLVCVAVSAVAVPAGMYVPNKQMLNATTTIMASRGPFIDRILIAYSLNP